MQKKLTYFNQTIVFQEVPDEVSLAIEIGGCVHRCAGCHSPHLWHDSTKYLTDDFDNMLYWYKDYITCVCFMGGDHNLPELMQLCAKAKSKGLKTCLYTGCDSIDDIESITPYLDYVKIGSYRAECGGLNSPTTNQRLYKLTHPLHKIDITYQMQKGS